jgi:hypothetical protein
LNFEEIAGLVNYIHEGDVLGHNHYAVGGSYTTELKNGEKTVALGIFNQNGNVAKVKVSFKEAHTSMVLAIVFIVVATLLLIGVVLTIFFFVRRSRVYDQLTVRN